MMMMTESIMSSTCLFVLNRVKQNKFSETEMDKMEVRACYKVLCFKGFEVLPHALLAINSSYQPKQITRWTKFVKTAYFVKFEKSH